MILDALLFKDRSDEAGLTDTMLTLEHDIQVVVRSKVQQTGEFGELDVSWFRGHGSSLSQRAEHRDQPPPIHTKQGNLKKISRLV